MLDSIKMMRSGGRAVERRTVNRGDGGSIPPTATLKLRQFLSLHVCLCLSDIKSRGSVSMSGEVKYHTQGLNVNCSGLTNSCWTLNAMQKAPSSI